MAQEAHAPEASASISRRGIITVMGAAGAAVLAPRLARAQTPPGGPVAPPSTVTTPPRDFGPRGAPNVYFTDPDVLTVEPAFNGLRQPNAPIQRLWTGALWSEGPAWIGQGRYLVWSDIPNNRQLRWLEDNGKVTVFRSPSNNSNGNTFDFQGRQLSCEHLTRRVVRYELDGSVTVHRGDVRRQAAQLAQRRGAPSGRQLLVHRSALRRPALRGRAGRRRAGRATGRAGSIRGSGSRPRSAATSASCRPPCTASTRAARVDSGRGRGQRAGSQRALLLARLQEALRGQHRQGAGRHRARAARARCTCSTWAPTTRSPTASSSATSWWTASSAGPTACAPTWRATSGARATPGRNVGYSGVTVWTPQGQLIGRIRLPEICGNVCFGGPKRNRLFMAASQSLYALYTGTQGAAPG